MADDNMTTTTVSSILMFVTVIFIAGLIFAAQSFGSKECPVGYEKIIDLSDSEIDTLCRGTENDKNVNCCRRISNPNEIYLWKVKEKEVLREVDLEGFDRLYEQSRICKDETLCGGVNRDVEGGCAGVACESGKVCFVEDVDGTKKGECLGGDETRFYFFESSKCGIPIEKDSYGSFCENELAKHCIFDSQIEVEKKKGEEEFRNAFRCAGGI